MSTKANEKTVESRKFIDGTDKGYVDVTLPADKIIVDHAWNTRKLHNYAGGVWDKNEAMELNPNDPRTAAKAGQAIEELAKLIKSDGLMNKPIVRDLGDGQWKLVAGFRRMDALVKVLGWKEIPVRLKKMTDSEAIRINIEENQARKDLTSPELADGAFRYAKALEAEGVPRKGGRAEGSKGDDVSGMLGYGSRIASEMNISKTAVNLYLRIMESVHPKIVAVWQDRTNPAQKLCTLQRLEAWCRMPHEDQWRRFRNLEKTGQEDVDAPDSPSIEGEGGEGTGATGEGGRTTPVLRMVKYDQCAEALAYFEAEIKTETKPETKQWMQGAIAALRWTMNKVKKERKGKEVLGTLGSYDPWAEDVEPTDENGESELDKLQNAALKKAEADKATATKNGGAHATK